MAKPKVAFIVPNQNNATFWQLVSDVSQVAAQSLGIELEIISSQGNHISIKNRVEQVAARTRPPDYLIWRKFSGNSLAMFKLLEEKKIKFITLEHSFTGDELTTAGRPQEKFDYWLGEILFDDKAGGELLLNALIAHQKQQTPEQKITITGIGGNLDTVSLNRQQPLDKYQINHPLSLAKVNQVFQLNWDNNLVLERFKLIENRYPTSNIYWCAGDEMALTIINLLNRPLVSVGGFDWLPEALINIKNNKMAASVGGHFIMAAIALVKISDYEQQHNVFLKAPLMQQFELITHNNVDDYIHFFNNKLWKKADFTQFLTAKNNKAPTLNVENLIKQTLHLSNNQDSK